MSASVVTHLGRISFRFPGLARSYTGLYAIQDGWPRKARPGGIITVHFDRPVPDGSGDHVYEVTFGVVRVPGLLKVLDDGEPGGRAVASRMIGEWCAANIRVKTA